MVEFVEWYRAYPKKMARADGERAWAKMNDADRDAAMAAVAAHVRYWEACGTERQYMPHPATWLNGRRWEDELEMPEIATKLIAWWSTDAGILAKGREVGCSPRPGEDMATYKSRVAEAIRRAA